MEEEIVKRTVVLFSALSLAPSLASAGSAAQQIGGCDDCAMVQRALADSQRIKTGAKRKDVEKSFDYEGGAQFPERGRYSYRSCAYIKLEVEFDAAPTRGTALTSPDDTVRSISKLFIDYPTKD